VPMRVGFILLSAALFAGCTTAYQPDGISGGYSDRTLTNNTVQVSFRGNRFTQPDTLHSYLLRRCAEVTMQDGFHYFVLVHEEEPNEGNTDSFGSKVTMATIQMYAGKPQGEAPAYDASFLLRQILAREGESEEPQPAPAVASTSEALPPPIPGAADGDTAAPASSRWPKPNPNPNALTNEPLEFDRL
jgi:cell division septation protein DedD